MTLATSGPDGTPHAAAVYFASDETRQNLYFFSEQGSLHSLDLSANPRAAAAIQPAAVQPGAERWQEIRGLQLHGVVQAVPQGEEWERAWKLYLGKFPFAGELQDASARSTLYTFRPDWIRWIDNRLGLGHKEEWTPE